MRSAFWTAWQCSCNHKTSCHPQALAERNGIASLLCKAMHMYPYRNCHPQTVGRKHRYCHFTCLDKGGGLKRRSNGLSGSESGDAAAVANGTADSRQAWCRRWSERRCAEAAGCCAAEAAGCAAAAAVCTTATGDPTTNGGCGTE